MDLGNFSVSLSVADIKASRTFYEGLGFVAIDDQMQDNWLIMKNGKAIIGLFHGMFEGNLMTFNPTDVRGVQRQAKANGITFMTEADESTEGQAHAMLADPDGNMILMDQHDPNYQPSPA